MGCGWKYCAIKQQTCGYIPFTRFTLVQANSATFISISLSGNAPFGGQWGLRQAGSILNAWIWAPFNVKTAWCITAKMSTAHVFEVITVTRRKYGKPATLTRPHCTCSRGPRHRVSAAQYKWMEMSYSTMGRREGQIKQTVESGGKISESSGA